MIRFSRVAYQTGHREYGLRGVSLHLPVGSVGFVVGPSGAGKTLLLSLCAGEVMPERGSVTIRGVDTREMSGRALRRMRTASGHITSRLPLLEHRTILDNVMVPFELRCLGWQRSVRASLRTLDELGLLDLAHCYPDDLSPGERQLAVVARAVAHRPALVLADEPLVALPAGSEPRVVQAFSDIASRGCAVFVASRTPNHAPPGARVWHLEHGIIESYDITPAQRTSRSSTVLSALLGEHGPP